MKIGVGITTCNREDVTNESVSKWRAMLPKDAVLVVVDDASKIPYPRADYRFEQNVGIARAKNKCLELLEDLGVDEFFLADNDVYPIDRGWWKPYVESPEPHLGYQFKDLIGPVKLHDMGEVYRDAKHVAYTAQRGCLLYYNKICLETVGGLDPIYGRAMYEHADLADRIHHAGLTSWRYADVADSARLWYSMDEYFRVKHTIDPRELERLYKANRKIHAQRLECRNQSFVPYREDRGTRDVVITSFLTSNPDPQRGVKWDPDWRILTPWLETMERGEWDGVVLADELKKLPVGYLMKVEQVPASQMNVYYQRWLHIFNYLRAHSEVRWVWCTDGSDVEVLRDPFKDMALGRLYVGKDNGKVGNRWMVDNHPHPILQHFMRTHAECWLLNAGVVGGDRATIMELTQLIVSLYNDIEADRFSRPEIKKREIGDMAAFNKVVYEHFGNRVNFGPHITTTFKAYEDNGQAKFKHK